MAAPDTGLPLDRSIPGSEAEPAVNQIVGALTGALSKATESREDDRAKLIDAVGENFVRANAPLVEQFSKAVTAMEAIVKGEAKIHAEDGEDAKSEAAAKNDDTLRALNKDVQAVTQKMAELQIGSTFDAPVSRLQAMDTEKKRLAAVGMQHPDAAEAQDKYMHEFLSLFAPSVRHKAYGRYAEIREMGVQAENEWAKHVPGTGHIYGATHIVPDVDEEGGLFVPQRMYEGILKRSPLVGGVREMADIVTIDGPGNTMKFPVQATRAEAKYLGSRDKNVAQDEVGEDVSLEIGINVVMQKHEVQRTWWRDVPQYAVEHVMAKIYQAILDKENRRFLDGNKVEEPRGILNYTLSDVDYTDHPYNKIQRVKTGVAGGFPTPAAGTSSVKPLIEATGAIHPGKLAAGASWLMGRGTITSVRSLTDGDGNLVWRDSVMAGHPAMLLGFSTLFDDWMPKVASNSNSILFLARGAYVILMKANEPLMLKLDDITQDQHDIVRLYRRSGGDLLDHWAAVVVRFQA